MLLKDKENSGRYFYISIWESFEHLTAYRETESVKQMKAALPADWLVRPADRVECELVGGILE